jgi:hypothetical protein
MPPVDRRSRLLLPLTVMALAMVVASTCSSCASAPPLSAIGRTRPQMHWASVTLRVKCPLSGMSYGSGVVYGKKVITAGHVASCRERLSPTIEVSPEPGSWYAARDVITLGHYDMTTGIFLGSDIASMTVDGLDTWNPPVAIVAQPKIGDTVCAATGMVPAPALRCGTVQPSVANDDIIDVDIHVEPGNSGAGVYNSNGNLVGIVVRFTTCFGGSLPCDGRATEIWRYRDLLEL